MCRPSTLNSLTLGMVREISAILEKACREGSGVDCIVVKGAGGKVRHGLCTNQQIQLFGFCGHGEREWMVARNTCTPTSVVACDALNF